MAAVEKIQLADDFSVYADPAARLEAEFIYKEIFVDGCYDAAAAALPDDALVVDAGANIGLFTLFVKQKHPRSTVLAFEPAPASFATFERNMRLHRVSGVHPHRCALGAAADSATTTTATLTFYPRMPGNSTLYADDKEVQMRAVDPAHPVAQLMRDAEEVPVDVRRLSDFLARLPAPRRVDLLKIDVEGAELDVLKGLDEAHWGLVDNIVVELCDSKAEFAVTKALLESKGFTVAVERPDWAPEELKMYMLIAKRG